MDGRWAVPMPSTDQPGEPGLLTRKPGDLSLYVPSLSPLISLPPRSRWLLSSGQVPSVNIGSLYWSAVGGALSPLPTATRTGCAEGSALCTRVLGGLQKHSPWPLRSWGSPHSVLPPWRSTLHQAMAVSHGSSCQPLHWLGGQGLLPSGGTQGRQFWTPRATCEGLAC